MKKWGDRDGFVVEALVHRDGSYWLDAPAGSKNIVCKPALGRLLFGPAPFYAHPTSAGSMGTEGAIPKRPELYLGKVEDRTDLRVGVFFGRSYFPYDKLEVHVRHL